MFRKTIGTILITNGLAILIWCVMEPGIQWVESIVSGVMQGLGCALLYWEEK